MADNQPLMEDRVLRILFSLAPPAAFFAIGGALLSRADLTLGSDVKRTSLSLAIIVVVLLVSVAAAAALRWLLLPRASFFGLGQGTARNAPPPLRDKLAQNVVLIGTLGIAGTAVAVILALALQKDKAGLATTLLSIFTSVVPVFATWVGTVMAFYFTNESFKQAAQSAQGAALRLDPTPITKPGTMIPYERIIRYEIESKDLASGQDAMMVAAQIKLNNFVSRFNPPGVVRVVIFDDNRHPVFVLNNDLMPANIQDSDTVQRYLDQGTNRDSALNFAFTAATATLDDAKRLIELRKVSDIFVTAHGRADEPVIGWVPDDNLNWDATTIAPTLPTAQTSNSSSTGASLSTAVQPNRTGLP